MALRRIGYWKWSFRDEYPFPQELRTEYPPGLGDKLVAYLESGAFFEQYRGGSWCRFGCPGANGSREFTDGRWVWPEGLAHYVRHHPVALPADFVQDVTGPSLPATAFRSQQPADTVDDSYWVNWARAYRVSAVDALLEEARAASSVACEAMLEAAANGRALGGLGTSTCITAACGRQVVVGSAFCGRCLAERDRDYLQSSADFLELRKLIERLPGAPR